MFWGIFQFWSPIPIFVCPAQEGIYRLHKILTFICRTVQARAVKQFLMFFMPFLMPDVMNFKTVWFLKRYGFFFSYPKNQKGLFRRFLKQVVYLSCSFFLLLSKTFNFISFIACSYTVVEKGLLVLVSYVKIALTHFQAHCITFLQYKINTIFCRTPWSCGLIHQ